MSNVAIISHTELETSDKWLINYFLSEPNNEDDAKYNIVKLEELVVERNETIDPQKFPDWMFAYIGLENIETNTGFLTNFDKRSGKEIKSRTKTFYGGDLLYGKLRPSLNKVYLAEKSFGGGICSTEIFVLKVREDKISPIVLRFLLSTNYVLAQIKSYTAGAALPRIHIKDFMSIKIPIPDKKKLSKLEKELNILNNEILKGRDLFLNSSQLNEQLFESLFVQKGSITILEKHKPNLIKLEGKLPFATGGL
ncbi:MAG: restriction endonuclease subunit S [Chitinophagaceae bacterium]|nr:restriction endonuclease subunit S [Chitinophagaceae bacterium]